jgi:hypothetical protein
VEQVVEGDVDVAKVEVDELSAHPLFRHESYWRDGVSPLPAGAHKGLVSIPCCCTDCRTLLDCAWESAADAELATRPAARAVTSLAAIVSEAAKISISSHGSGAEESGRGRRHSPASNTSRQGSHIGRRRWSSASSSRFSRVWYDVSGPCRSQLQPTGLRFCPDLTPRSAQSPAFSRLQG